MGGIGRGERVGGEGMIGGRGKVRILGACEGKTFQGGGEGRTYKGWGVERVVMSGWWWEVPLQ